MRRYPNEIRVEKVVIEPLFILRGEALNDIPRVCKVPTGGG